MADQPFFQNAANTRHVALNLDNLSADQTLTLLDETGSVKTVTVGSGSPEGSVTATVGRWYVDDTNGVKWEKRTGTGNTGWSPTASVGSTINHTAVGTLTVDFAAAQNVDIELDANITTLSVSNLSLVQTAQIGIKIGTTTSVISALDGAIEVASGALGDIGSTAGDKATLFFRYDNTDSVVRCFITAG